MTDTVDRSVGVYAPRGGRVAMFGVHRVEDPRLPADPRAEIQLRYAGLGPRVDALLERCPAPEEVYYDQVAQVVAPRWSAGRVALVGDAAGAVSLLAGQGASLAVAGGTLLARRLLELDVATASAAYEHELRPVVEEKQEAGRRAAGSFVPRDRLGLWTRRAALRGLRVPGLRQILLGRLVGKQAELFGA
jgi:2-polyprenyl-6-methoxyphenol hydroxylase-like FAD-dependent oxidoreductase